MRKKRSSFIAILVTAVIVLACVSVLLLLFDFNHEQFASKPISGVTPVREIYGFGNQAGQLINPASVSFAPGSTHIWCADQGNFRLVDFYYTGTMNSVFETDNAGTAFDFPSDIALGSKGMIYVAQSTYNKVTIYDKDRNLVEKLEVPSPVSVAANDDILIIGCVAGFALYQSDGTYITWVGTRGRGEDQFDTINGVAIDAENNIYVVDSFNKRLSKYSTNGIRAWIVNLGEGEAKLQVPMGITIDGAGRLVVIDNLDFSISTFSAETGEFIAKYGEFGHESGQFAYPADISYNAATDTFAVADSGNQRLQVVRIPDSGGPATSAVVRTMAGPLRALLISVGIILAALMCLFGYRKLRRYFFSPQARRFATDKEDNRP